MFRVAVLVITLVAVSASALVGCSPTASLTPTAGPSNTAPAKTSSAPTVAPTPSDAPKYGGIFTGAINGTPPSLDPQQESTLNTAQIVSPSYTTLVQADPLKVDKWVPGLAEKWEVSQDSLTWTFDIRQGVKFHDGTAATADDAVFSLKRLTDPPKGIVSNQSFLFKAVVKSVDKEGNKVKIALNYPFALMTDTLGHNYSAMYSQKYVEKQGDMKATAMGTGPFKLKSYTPGVSLEGVKNSDFWVKGRPYLDGYRYLIIRDDATRLSAFRTGQVNITPKRFGALRPDDAERLKTENSALRFYPSPSPVGSWFFMNTTKPPFKDQRVRKAVSLALDRQAALKVLAQGNGVISKVFSVEPWGIPMDEILKMPGYRQPKDADIAEARKLMQAARYPDGFELTILSRNMAVTKDAATFMTSQVAQLGIKAKVEAMEDAVFWDIGRKSNHQAMVYTPGWILPDPHIMGRFLAPGNPLNFSGNDDDKEFAQMWDEQLRAVDTEKRKALMRKVEEHLLDALPGVSIAWYNDFTGVRPEVKNFTPGFSDYVGNTLEEIWLAK